MDQFPEDFHRSICEKELDENQKELLRNTRAELYETYQKAKQDCEQVLVLTFPKKLWHIHRRTLTVEILDRFGDIKVTNCNEHEALVAITDPARIPQQIKSVTIEFKTL